MGRNVARVRVEGPAEALAVHELRVELAREERVAGGPHVVLVGFVEEYLPIELALEPPGERRPVRPHRLEPLEDELRRRSAAVPHEPRVALLRALRRAAQGRHEEALEQALELDLEARFQAVLLGEGRAPPPVQPLRERGRDLPRSGAVSEQDEERVGIPVDHLEALALDERLAAPDDLVPAHRDAAREPRIEEAAPAGAEHPVEGVHEDLDRVLERLVPAPLRFVPVRPEIGDEVGQDPALAREDPSGEPRHRVGARLGEAEGVDAEGADDARIQALEVEQGDVPVEPRARVEDVAARALAASGEGGADVRRDPPAPVQARQVEVVEGGDGSPRAAEGEPRDPAPLDHEVDEAGAVEDRPYETAVLEVVGGEGEPVGLVELANRVDAVPVRVPVRCDELVAPEEIARDRPEALVLEPPERGAVSLDAVQHHPPRDPRGRHRAVEDARPPAVPAEGELEAVEAAARLEETQVEAGDVPADDEVRVVVRDPGEEGAEDRGLVGEKVHRRRAASHRETEEGRPGRRIGPGVDEEDGLRPFVPGRSSFSRSRFRPRCRTVSGTVSGARGRALAGGGRLRPGPRVGAAHRDRPELLPAVVPVEPRGLDVERHGAKARAAVPGAHPGVDVLDEPLAVLRASGEGHGSGHEALHEEAIGGPHIGLVELGPAPLAERLELALGAEVEGVDGGPVEGRERYLAPPDAGG